MRTVVLMTSLGLAVAALAQSTAPPTGAEGHYRDGQEWQAKAEMSASAADARRLYREAVTEYEAALAAENEHCPARLYLAVCLSQLAALAEPGPDRLSLLRAADRRYAAAADCTGVDPAVYGQWAILLRIDLYNALADPGQRQAVLERVIQVCERGLAVTTVPTPRAQLQRHLGSALLYSAGFMADPAPRRHRLERAVDNLRAAHKVVAARQSLYQDNDLGAALMTLGNLTGDHDLYREAVAELESALKFYPEHYDTYYNLATAYCLLGETERAGEYLAVAIDHDANGEYARHAAVDPLLAPMRNSAAYTAALDRRRRQLAETKAGEYYRQGLVAQQTAERTKDTATAIALLSQAVEQYEQTVGLMPDHYQAQALCAVAFARLGELSDREPDQQQRHFAAARRQFTRASQCAGADARLYQQWSMFLLNTLYPRTKSASDQRRVLGDARHVIEAGIRRARFSGLRGQLESQLGSCLVLLAQLEPRPASDDNGGPPDNGLPSVIALSTSTNATAYYTAAIKHFQAASDARTVDRSANFYELWGLALVGAGRAANDPHLIRQATERLLKSLELQPGNPRAEYNLACAYAQLHQLELAWRHLERCLDRDAEGLFAAAALQDPDLEPLRRTAWFQRLSPPREPINEGSHPTVSDK